MGTHRKPAKKKRGSYFATGVALEAAALFAFAYAIDSHVAGANLLATSIFVDGTKSILGPEEGVPFYRMADSFKGGYSGAGYNEHFVLYPRSFGPLTGLGDPTYDASEAQATANTVEAVRQAKRDPGYRAGDPIYIVGYSQGAGAAANAIPELETEEFAYDNVQFVLASNPRRNDGGLLARLPAGVYVPVIGVSFGEGTTTTDPDTKVLQVTKQYDGVADSPDYVFNVVADANAVLGFHYLHSGYYKDVERIDPQTIDPESPLKGMIVSTNSDGTITDVVLVAPEGELPLTMPLRQLGVPRDVVVALDPFLRSVIESGYSRPVGPGAYPDQPVPFRLVPPPNRWLSDVETVAAGAAETTQRLAALRQQGSFDPLTGQLPESTDDSTTAPEDVNTDEPWGTNVSPLSGESDEAPTLEEEPAPALTDETPAEDLEPVTVGIHAQPDEPSEGEIVTEAGESGESAALNGETPTPKDAEPEEEAQPPAPKRGPKHATPSTNPLQSIVRNVQNALSPGNDTSPVSQQGSTTNGDSSTSENNTAKKNGWGGEPDNGKGAVGAGASTDASTDGGASSGSGNGSMSGSGV